MGNEQDIVEIPVSDEHGGERIDKFLAAKLHISRTRVKRALGEGLVVIDKKIVTPHYRLRVGDVIQVRPIEADTPPVSVAEDIPLDIVFEDSSLIVINKPAGMVVHPAPGHYSGTLYNALLFHLKEEIESRKASPGLVHRLDRDTTGLILAAKSEEVLNILSGRMKERKITRLYRAFVWGHLRDSEGEIEAGIGRHPHDRKKMSTYSVKKREAVTVYRVLERFAVCDYVDVRLLTGRTHQVRVHFSSIGHPLVGDETYGGGEGREAGFMGEGRKQVKSLLRLMRRQALHAYSLGFVHPVTDQEMDFSAPLPEDMQRVFNELRSPFDDD